MKILIVNGFPKNYDGTKRFNEFVAIIKDVYSYLIYHLLDFLEAKAILNFIA